MEIHDFNVAMASQLFHDIDSGILPQEVYKYRTIAQVDRFLDDRKLYFAKPEQFNDPFEGKYYFESSENPVASKLKIAESNAVIHNFGIFCIGIDPANLIMWSHYCDFHKGATMGFDMKEDPEFFAGAIPVLYHAGYPRFRNIDSKFSSSLQHKFLEWNHEKEVRVIKPKSGLMEVKAKALRTIIFGAKASEENIDRIILKAQESGFENVKFKRCVLDGSEYRLNIVEL